MRYIALLCSLLIFIASVHTCIGELEVVRTFRGDYISVFQEDCHKEESTCHKKSEKEDNGQSGCCDFGICSCTLTYISSFQNITLSPDLPVLNNTKIGYVSFQLKSLFTGDIFEPPQAA